MALLNLRKKNIEAKTAPKKETAAKKVAVVESPKAGTGVPTHKQVIIRPHVTEKASAAAERGVYVFEVARGATKGEIAKAVAVFYKVTPVKVTIVTIPAKNVIVKGNRGVRQGGKKAYVFLKKGEKIEIV